MSLNRLLENAIKLNDKLNQLRTVLRPAIEAARNREVLRNSSKVELMHTPLMDQDDALLEAGEILGVE